MVGKYQHALMDLVKHEHLVDKSMVLQGVLSQRINHWIDMAEMGIIIVDKSGRRALSHLYIYLSASIHCV